ncbi:bifunctional methylenetetrahydrofolate dehydrogenase/methenyltetrahydrofolate cyclohydrolase FolD [Clostridiisalibacter paucivorans]|uniref:bifunctional methylenetetrahydrofolate dehydrogenase/methenyltetrahydrofolate cyclohydrolase FolD n=1 Tax=Clostridiisalibacter paucivorans TaxID=408753 RepID=UPI00047DECE1|nr:bifunctional methylenetetrahydrofolate dehydrogenase/methenyltetrahydrofolate cyclohydrolase FolD [Clostridiisalibacter paucivorans]
MDYRLLDGKKVSNETKEKIAKEAKRLTDDYGVRPGLAVVLVGNDPASQLYVNMKEKACKKANFYSKLIQLDERTSQDDVIDVIEDLNKNDNIHGILLQLPLPNGMNEKFVNSKISPEKDVDGFHAINAGNLFLGDKGFIPCTPKGILRLIKYYDIEIEGKDVVVIGRSNIVGKPAGLLLLNENATVTICHSKTRNISEYTKKADILISAVGRPHLIKKDMVKLGAIVVDAGTSKVDGKLYGDVDFENVKNNASWITPVPGGVGPMTIAMLLENTLEAYKKKWK